MPEILISMSAGGYAKGDRVIVRAKKDEWYIGTVTRSGAKTHITFDDGATATVDPSDYKHVKYMKRDRKVKRALTDEQAAKIIADPVKKGAKADKPEKAAKPVKEGKAKVELIRLTPNRGAVVDEVKNAVLTKLFRKYFPGAPMVKPTKSSSRFATRNTPPVMLQANFPAGALPYEPHFGVRMSIPTVDETNPAYTPLQRSIRVYGQVSMMGTPTPGIISGDVLGATAGLGTVGTTPATEKIVKMLLGTGYSAMREDFNKAKFEFALKTLKDLAPAMEKIVAALPRRK